MNIWGNPDDALKGAMFHLRMTLAGHSGYSGTPSPIDEGWAALVKERLAMLECEIVPMSSEKIASNAPEWDARLKRWRQR